MQGGGEGREREDAGGEEEGEEEEKEEGKSKLVEGKGCSRRIDKGEEGKGE